MDLSILGWHRYASDKKIVDLNPARVISVNKTYSLAIKENKEVKFYQSGPSLFLQPSIGDWVIGSSEFMTSDGRMGSILKKILPRKTKISRLNNKGEQILAANINTVFVVTSANQDFNINRLQRYLTIIANGGAEAVIVLSKIDLAEDYKKYEELIQTQLNVSFISVSLFVANSINTLVSLMPLGSTSVFVGSSGVGKSSIINQLIGKDQQKTVSIRESDGRGRHTTTSSHLFQVENKGLVIDTPGLREVQIVGDNETLEKIFPEVFKFMSECHFSNCQHDTEPYCGLKLALKEGKVCESAYLNYLKLKQEIDFTRRKGEKKEVRRSKSEKKKYKRIKF